MSTWYEQLQKRKLYKVKTQRTDKNPKTHILLAESDVGVYRNGGRRGAKFGPQAIVNNFENLSVFNSDLSYQVTSVSSPILEEENFVEGQSFEIQEIKNIRKTKTQNLIHIGGGHDHAMPFCLSNEEDSSPLFIINIDAHMDTRNDELVHSGTPFRQVLKETKRDIFILQLGIHDYANQSTNSEGISDKKMKCLSVDYCLDHNIEDLLELHSFKDEPEVFLSIDCDGLESSVMSAVSAVNHNGLPATFLKELLLAIKLKFQKRTLGIYEYNPIYDDLNQKGSRFLASLLVDWLR